MSGPSSEPRTSLSSETSVVSSNTLNSRYSSLYASNGEGSYTPLHSSPTRVGSSSRADGSIRHGGNQASSSAQSSSPLGRESVEEQDFVHRRHRSRKSGGFLLDSAFPPATGMRTPPNHIPQEDVDNKGKRKAHGASRSLDAGTVGKLRRDKAGSSGSSPLSREVESASYDAGESTPEGRAQGTYTAQSEGHHVPKSSKPDGGSSTEHAKVVKPSSATDQKFSRGAIDPSQIVHMALNLSESRRRNISAGQLLAQPVTSPRRVTSVGPPSGSHQNYGAGGSLRQHLQQQRRIFRNASPGTGRSSPSASRHASTSTPRNISGPTSALQGHTYGYTFSDATLARRDKARAYIELSMEYLRLLQFLPPLKPDASAPGNFIVSTSNIPGTSNAQLSRTLSYANHRYELGRNYNPLQFIRNRRTRARNREVLEYDTEEFQDVGKVKNWVDTVEKNARQPDYRQQDLAMLPSFGEENTAKEPAPSKPARPRMVWAFSPAELLADAYWLEHDDHKSVIEDRRGNKIFPPKKQVDLQPRSSKEYSDKRRKSWIEPIISATSSDPQTGDESEGVSERGRKRRLLIPKLRGDSIGRVKRHGWRGSGTHSRSDADTSDSEDHSTSRRSRKSKRITSNEDNTGPLERQMKEMLEKEAKDADMTSPSVGSPDKWGDGHPLLANDMVAPGHVEETNELDQKTNELGHNEAISSLSKRHTDTVLSPDSIRDPRSSFEDLDSTGPNTPVITKFVPGIGVDLSPPHSRRPSVTRKPKKSKLDIFRSEGSVRGHSSEPHESATDEHKHKSSRHASGDGAEANGAQTKSTAVKHLLTHKKNNSVGSLVGSSEGRTRKDTKDTKDSGSAVSRFFKGSRFGEIVRNEGSRVGEFIFRREPATEDSETSSVSSQQYLDDSESDDGNEMSNDKLRLNAITRTATSTTAGSAKSKKFGRYHMDLPSFRSSAVSQSTSSSQNQPDAIDPTNVTDSQILDHHIYRQALARQNARSPRFSRLAPPRIDLTSLSNSARSSRHHSPSTTRAHLHAILERPGTVGRGNLPITSLAKANMSPSPHRSASRPKLDGKRHWSITDRTSPSRPATSSATAITKADIARIRALLLCSGIKAREIDRRAHATRNPPPAFLRRAARTAGAKLYPVSKKEEHVLAARILVSDLERSAEQLQDAAERFRSQTCGALESRIGVLRVKVEDELFPRVRESGDKALAIASEVAGTAPLLVKGVADKVDAMMRMRRRRMRWVRRIGWMLVEWVLLAVMWWVWFVVVLVRLARGVVVGLIRGIRWFLWV
ncbi:uncharacterized protein K441DRAFT_650399 [Cenococcum geophilum 1.58]|uniref:uncharacterized protein n=1 Tax=Cenococcum geophilum 1.58 TaxID=794803 RepID=UPI00358F47EE|nr:hypothetical protein K441DRAFT_650399 [Cenococcum geophilum 1.58]